MLSAIKEKLISRLSKYQIAVTPGHRPQEHIYVIKSVISCNTLKGKPTILQMWDLSKFFDKECLIDCLNEVYKYDIKGKLYRLLYALNKNTKFCVQTPVGVTKAIDRGEGVGQGTLEGALISAVNLDSGVQDFFKSSKHEATYGPLYLSPLLYQDDVARLCRSVSDAQAGNSRMETLSETKLLNYNLEKSCFLVLGKKKAKEEVQSQLKSTPLTLCGQAMMQSDSAKYLGDWLSSDGLADSVRITISKRLGLTKMAIFETRSIIEDCRSMLTGGLSAGVTIWESSIVPKLLYNSECWLEISKPALQQLESVQLQFLRVLLATGSGCPKPALYWDTGIIMMKYRILKSKLLFLHHLEHLPDDSLAKEVYKVQKELNLPGLYKECSQFLTESGILDVKGFSKYQWKKIVSRKIVQLNKMEILETMKSYKKLDVKEYENLEFCQQTYLKQMDVSKARLNFKIRAQMAPTIKMNFKNDPAFKNDVWMCDGCRSHQDTQKHVLSCSAYKDLRKNLDLDKENDLVEYFSLVIRRRKTV